MPRWWTYTCPTWAPCSCDRKREGRRPLILCTRRPQWLPIDSFCKFKDPKCVAFLSFHRYYQNITVLKITNDYRSSEDGLASVHIALSWVKKLPSSSIFQSAYAKGKQSLAVIQDRILVHYVGREKKVVPILTSIQQRTKIVGFAL